MLSLFQNAFLTNIVTIIITEEQKRMLHLMIQFKLTFDTRLSSKIYVLYITVLKKENLTNTGRDNIQNNKHLYRFHNHNFFYFHV